MDTIRTRPQAQRELTTAVENPPGIFRTTMAYNDQTMLCHFRLLRGARIPLHAHPQAQNGYMISGKVKFMDAKGGWFIALPGSGWCFDGGEQHGAEVLEDSEVVEVFSPLRPDYL